MTVQHRLLQLHSTPICQPTYAIWFGVVCAAYWPTNPLAGSSNGSQDRSAVGGPPVAVC
jgi:hypothetical protein